jgi:putative transposase
MKRGYKYRIYPTEEQKNYFKVCFAANRWFWNYALDKVNAQYEKDKTHLSAQYKIARDLPSLKKEESTCWIGQ